MARGATTRFLLGRRGAKMYPLRGSTSSTSTSIFSSTASTSPTLVEPASTNSGVLGRHSVPPPKPSWNCKKQHQPQQAYVYGFPLLPNAHTSHGRSWLLSPLVLVTLTLLCACFLGAHFLVLRIDQTLTATATSIETANSKYPTASLQRGNTILQKLEPPQTTAEPLLVPLYLNMTLFRVPCDDVNVQVLQQPNNIHQADRLVYKNVQWNPNNRNSPSLIGTANATKSTTSSSTNAALHNTHHEAQSTTTTTMDNEHKLKFSSFHLQRRRRRLQQEDNDNNNNNNNMDIPTTMGCQIMGHLQLPLGHNDRPSVVSIQAQQQTQSLSHRIDNLRIGSVRAFPKEETLLLHKFQPHNYNNLTPQDTLVTHRYQINDNFHLVEQPDEPQPQQQQQPKHDIQHITSFHQQSSRHMESPEIRMIFAPPASVL